MTSKQERQLLRMTKPELEQMFKVSSKGFTKRELVTKIIKQIEQ